MFCKKCGAQIADDSEFCSKCGVQQEITPEEHIQKYCANCGHPVTNEIICPKCNKIVETTIFPEYIKTTKALNLAKKISTIIIAIILCALLIVAGIFITEMINKNNRKNNGSSSNDGSSQIFTRDATINDINYTESINLNELSIIYYITPKSNINDLEITLKFYDKEGEILKSVVKTLGDVEKGEECKFTLTITEFPNILKFESSTIEVSNGTISKLK